MDAARLLETLMSGALSGGAQRMMGQAPSDGLGGLLSGMLGGGQMGQSSPGGLGGGGLSGALMGMLGNLAMQKMAGVMSGGGASAPAHGGGAPFSFPGAGGQTSAGGGGGLMDLFGQPEPPTVPDDKALLMIRGMIAAAKADGNIDSQEQNRILGHLEQAGMGTAERDFLVNEMRQPLDLAALLQQIDSPQMAIEFYTFSLMAITLDTQAEAQYLRTLAQRLQLNEALVNGLHQQFGAPAIF
jgi:uncharacterized membrane protein YebE (DUF533 family)